MGMANRAHSLDMNDKAVLRGCLDTLQVMFKYSPGNPNKILKTIGINWNILKLPEYLYGAPAMHNRETMKLALSSNYDEVWVLPYISVHQEGQNQLIDSFTEI